MRPRLSNPARAAALGARAERVEESVEPGGPWFDDIDSIKTFVGEDYEVAHVPERAREVLSRFDARSAHFEVLDRRKQEPA